MKKIAIICLVSLACLFGLLLTQPPLPASSSPMGFTNTPEPSETPVPLPTATLVPQPTATPALVPTEVPTSPPSQPSSPPALPATGKGLTAPEALSPQSVIGTLRITGLDLKVPVERVTWTGQEWDISALGQNVGWLENTAPLNHAGNTGLVGHLDLDTGLSGPFSKLDRLPLGSQIELESGQQKYIYQVHHKYLLSAEYISVLNPTEETRLTLVTCLKGSWNEALQSYQRRLVVVAYLLRVEDLPLPPARWHPRPLAAN